MSKQEIIELRTEAEAQLYMAVAKADNVVTDREQVTAIYYSRKCESLMDIMDIDKEIKKRIGEKVKELFNDKSIDSLNADDHLKKSVNLFQKVLDLGDHTVKKVMEKHRSSLLRLAQVDGYLYKESMFITKIQSELSKIS